MSEQKLEERMSKLFTAGAHYGYSKTRRHPSVAPFILTTKNRVDIVDLEKTEMMLDKALEFIKKLSSQGKQIIFVGVKPEAKKIITNASLSMDMPYVTERWIGGTLTNFPEIKKRIARLEELRSKKEKGELDVYTKKERLLIDEQIEKLGRFFGGLVLVKKMPDALFVIDSKREHIAVTEAKKAGIPVVFAAIDGKNKTVHVGQVFELTENMEEDIKTIKESFIGMVGINPKKKYITLQT